MFTQEYERMELFTNQFMQISVMDCLLPMNSMYLYTIFCFKDDIKGQDEHREGLFQL